MRLRSSWLLSLLPATLCSGATFAVLGTQPGPWPAVLSSVGHVSGAAATAEIIVAPAGTPSSLDWQARVKAGAAIILEGSSPLASGLGFVPGNEILSAIRVVDVHDPALPVIWNRAVDIPRYRIPENAKVFAKEKWSGAPLMAGYRLGAGAVLWAAVSPGASGYERFPYLMQALSDLGFGPSVRASRLWAFFDDSYRTRADADYLAERWRKAGIGALHVASWHFFDSDPVHDEYLKKLIAACHRHGVLVYAWVELPHVSEKFWNDHPEWREKTAVGQDAQLDWRKLINLQNPQCVEAIRTGLRAMIERFEWDGVNLAELYFESLEGAGNPARFTPMNADARARFEAQSGWDPLEIWGKHNDAKSLREYLDFRAGLAREMQETWLKTVEGFRSFRPGLDVVLTHVDDRFDAGMKDAIGADAARVLPLLDNHSFSFLIEDPATVWNLGPQRYPEIAKRYKPLTQHQENLAIDINIVDRYQDVYPTKQQTGMELFELVHLASASFPRVALYSENSILKADLPLLAASSAVVSNWSHNGRRTSLEATGDVEVKLPGEGVLVDGRPWPLAGRGFAHLPSGAHTIEAAPKRDAISVVDLNARLRSAAADNRGISFSYASDSQAIAVFDRRPAQVEVDGAAFHGACTEGSANGECAMLLPRGEHRVTVN